MLPCVTKTVVVVDDDPALLYLIEDALRLIGAEVQSFSSGVAAIEQADWSDVDAAVVDWMMPGMNGLEVLTWVEQHHPRVTCVMLTAAPDALLGSHPEIRKRAAVIAKTDFPGGLYSALGLA